MQLDDMQAIISLRKQVKELEQQLKEAESVMKNIQDEHELDFTCISEYFDKYKTNE